MKKEKIILWLSLFVVMLAMNVLTPLSYGDDYAYAFTMTEPNHLFNMERPIRNLWDILLSQWNHWQSFNGRFTPHFLLQLFVGILGKDIFNVFNALVFCGVVWLLLSLSDFRDKITGAILIFAAYLLLMPSLSETVLWTAGSLNYLWTSFFVFLFLFWIKNIEKEQISTEHVLTAPVAIFAGWTNEVMTLPVTLVIFVYVLYYLKSIWRKAMTPYLLFFVLGTLLNIFAPSTFQKAHTDGFFDMMIGVVAKFKTFLIQIIHLKVFWLLVVLMLILWWKTKIRFVSFLKSHIWLAIILVFSFVPILLSGMVDARIRYGVEFFSLLFILRLLGYFHARLPRYVSVLLLGGGIICCIPVYYYQYKNYKNWKLCELQLKHHDRLIVITPADDIPDAMNGYVRKMVFFRGENYFLPCDKDRKETKSVSAFYGKRDLFFFPQSLWEKIQNLSNTGASFIMDEELYAKELFLDETCNGILIHVGPAADEDIPFYMKPVSKYIQRLQDHEWKTNNVCEININGKRFLVFPALEREFDKRIISLTCFN